MYNFLSSFCISNSTLRNLNLLVKICQKLLAIFKNPLIHCFQRNPNLKSKVTLQRSQTSCLPNHYSSSFKIRKNPREFTKNSTKPKNQEK